MLSVLLSRVSSAVSPCVVLDSIIAYLYSSFTRVCSLDFPGEVSVFFPSLFDSRKFPGKPTERKDDIFCESMGSKRLYYPKVLLWKLIY